MAKTMNELLDIINASDPEAGEEFLKLLQPEKVDRYEMGSILEATLGHDLTSYYDKKDIGNYLKFLENYFETHTDTLEASDIDGEEIREYIKENREDIINHCYDEYDGQRALYIHATVDAVLEGELGYNISDIIGDVDIEPSFDDDGNIIFDGVDVDDEEPDEDLVDVDDA